MVDIKKVAWNASEGIIMEVSNRRSYANNHFVNGDIARAFRNLIAIKQSVIQSFSKKERDALKELEEKFHKAANYLSKNNSSSFSEDIRKAFHLAKNYVSKIYSEYNDSLMDLLEKYGYLIGESTDASRMKF